MKWIIRQNTKDGYRYVTGIETSLDINEAFEYSFKECAEDFARHLNKTYNSYMWETVECISERETKLIKALRVYDTLMVGELNFDDITAIYTMAKSLRELRGEN